MNGNGKKLKVQDIDGLFESNAANVFRNVQLSYNEVMNIVGDLKKTCKHLENFDFIIGNDDTGRDEFENQFVIENIAKQIKKSAKQSIYPTMCAHGGTGHTLGFIFGRNKDNKPYILHYDYNFEDQDTDICNAIAEQYKKTYGEDLYILRIPKLQNNSMDCMFFQLMLMRYMKPEYIEKYMEKAKPGVNPIELKDLPKKLLSYYQSRKLNEIAPELWEQNRKDGHIVKEKVYDKEAGGEVLKDQNKKAQYKKQMLHGKYWHEEEYLKKSDQIDVDDVISKTDSEIAGQQIAGQQDTQTNECFVKRFFKNLWKKLKGFLYGIRPANNNQTQNNLNNMSSCELKK